MKFARAKSVMGRAAVFLFAFAVGKGLAFFGPLLLSQIMTVQDYGTSEIALSIGVIAAQILSLGVPGAIPQLVLIQKSGRVLDLIFFVVASIGMLGLGLAAAAYAISASPLHIFVPLTMAGGAAQLAASVYYRANGRRFGILVADNLSLYLFILVSGLVFITLGRVPLAPVIAGYGAVTMGFTAFALTGLARTLRPHFLAAYAEARRMGFFMMMNSLVYFAIVNSSRILIGYFLSVESVSVYSVCFRIAMAIFLVHQLIGTAFFKQLYEAPIEWFDKYYLLLLALTIIVAGGLLMIFEMFGKILLPGWIEYNRQISSTLPIVCMQIIWWVSLAQLELRINRALISKQVTSWLLVCAGLMVGILATLRAIGVLTLPVAALVFAATLFITLQIQLFLLSRNGVRLPRMRVGVLVPLLFLIPAFFLGE